MKRKKQFNHWPGILVAVLIIFMTITMYLNQEVPACISFTPQNISQEIVPITNYTQPIVAQMNEELNLKDIAFKTKGHSMEPLIHENQICNCEKSEEYKIGDTVIYFADTGYGYTAIAHQIVFTDGQTFTIKGLNNSVADGNIQKEDILCKIPLVRKWRLI